MIGDEAFEALAQRLGRDRLNAFAVERGIPKTDPGWTGAVQMIPLLDALDERIERVQNAMEAFPESMRAAGTEIARGLGADIASQSLGAIRSGMASDLTDRILPALQLVADEHRAELQKTANTLEERAKSFGNGAQAAIDRLTSSASDVRNHVAQHARILRTSLLARFAWSVGVAVLSAVVALAGSRFVFHEQCGANIAHVRAYHSSAQLRQLIMEYCP